MTFRSGCFVLSLLLASALCAALRPAAAAPAAGAPSAEAEAVFDHSTVRLLNAGAELAGVEIDLAGDWKTYWRVPGDAGKPPDFDWSGSENLASARVIWPAPQRFTDLESGETIGYKHRVVFPVVLKAKDPARPILLRLNLDYALCNEICIRADARLARVISASGASSEARALVREYMKLAPVPSDALKVISARVRTARERPELVLAIRGEGLDEMTEIFVEGPPLASFCHPRFIGAEGGVARYFLPVDGIAGPEDLRGAELTLTILAGEKRVEQKIRLP